MRPLPILTAITFSLVITGRAAHAGDRASGLAGLTAPMRQFLARGELDASVLREAFAPPAKRSERARKPSSTITTGDSGVVADLVGLYPRELRATMTTMFAGLRDGYPEVERTLGIEAGDLAGAAAVLVVASFEAYTDTTLGRETYAPVLDQLRAVLARSADVAAASATARRALYDRLSLTGMYLLALRANLADSPDAAATRTVRAAAGAYLRAVGADPDALAITGKGIVAAVPDRDAEATPSGSPPTAEPTALPAIEAVCSYQTTSVGYGGWITYEWVPIVLFADHAALSDVASLHDPAGLDADKQAHPDHWTTWRKRKGSYETYDGTRWVKREVFAKPRAEGTRLDGRYQHFSGGATYGAGGMTAAAWNDLTFDRRGRFTMGGGVGAATDGVATQRRAADTGGTYEIDGFTLTLRFDDGTVVRRALMIPGSTTSVIWLDGVSYTSES